MIRNYLFNIIKGVTSFIIRNTNINSFQGEEKITLKTCIIKYDCNTLPIINDMLQTPTH